MKTKFLFLSLLAVGACDSAQKPAPLPIQADSSGSETCRIDVERSKALARQGDVQSARNLVGYYSDCLSRGVKDESKDWALVAAELGNMRDENEFLRVLRGDHFPLENLVSDCARFDAAASGSRDDKSDLPALHALIEYAIFCQGSGVDASILDLSSRAAAIGAPADAAFAADLLKFKKRPRTE